MLGRFHPFSSRQFPREQFGFVDEHRQMLRTDVKCGILIGERDQRNLLLRLSADEACHSGSGHIFLSVLHARQDVLMSTSDRTCMCPHLTRRGLGSTSDRTCVTHAWMGVGLVSTPDRAWVHIRQYALVAHPVGCAYVLHPAGWAVGLTARPTGRALRTLRWVAGLTARPTGRALRTLRWVAGLAARPTGRAIRTPDRTCITFSSVHPASAATAPDSVRCTAGCSSAAVRTG